MQWASLGFTENPFSTEPITQATLNLYTGHSRAITKSTEALEQKNVLMVIKGSRGVGTTSFANFLRFSSQSKKEYFTPRNEIRVEPQWGLETLLAVIIANIIREIELFHPEQVTKDVRFQNAKAISSRIAEAYRSFGIEAFGVGMNYGKNAGIVTQPIIVSSAVLGHHLEDLSALILTLPYRYGTLIQLNNLDIGTIHEEKHLKYLFNALRDYVQTDGMSWLLVGDIGLRRFIAQSVDRLDDIVTAEVEVNPLERAEYEALIEKRLDSFKSNEKVIFPIDKDVFTYLYDVTQGRLRYIFGLLHRLVGSLHIGDLSDRLTLKIAKPMISQLAKERIGRHQLTPSEELLLQKLVAEKKLTVTELAKLIGKSMNNTSNLLAKLAERRLVTAQKKGKNKYYIAELDAIIAYSN